MSALIALFSSKAFTALNGAMLLFALAVQLERPRRSRRLAILAAVVGVVGLANAGASFLAALS